MSEILEAEIAAAIRRFIDEHGVLYYQHAQELAHAIMLPVGHIVAQIQNAPIVERTVEEVKTEAKKAEAKVETVVLEAEAEAKKVIEEVETKVTNIKSPKTKRTPRKKGTDGESLSRD